MTEQYPRKFGYYLTNEAAGTTDVKKASALSGYVFERDIFFDLCGNMERTNLKKMFQQLHPGDTVFFYSLDGLFKSSRLTQQMLEAFRENRIDIRVLDLPSTLFDVDYLYSSDKSFSDIVMDFITDVIAKAARKESIASRNRQSIGFNEAKRNGVKLGRRAKPLPPTFEDDYRDWKNGKCTAASIYRRYGWSNPCFYRRVKQYEMNLLMA